MPFCGRCATKVGLFSFRSFSKQTGRCNKCDDEVQQAVIRFIDSFRKFASDGVLTKDEWGELTRAAERDGLGLDEALYYAHPDVIELIRRGVEIATKDGVVTKHEENYLSFLTQILAVPQELAEDVRATVAEYKAAQEVRRGNLPAVQPTVYLTPHETCYMESDAVYINTDTKTYPRRHGRLLATSEKLMFASAQGGFEVNWNRVMTVARDGDMVYLEMSIKRGNGLYIVERPVFTEAVISRLAESAREQARRREGRRQYGQEEQRRDAPFQPRPAKRTAYETLNLRPGAGPEDIRLAYREMAKLYHPDKVASLAAEFRQLAEVRMKEINAAYQELTR